MSYESESTDKGTVTNADGDEIQIVTGAALEGDTFEGSEATEKDGYVFVGWYTEDGTEVSTVATLTYDAAKEYFNKDEESGQVYVGINLYCNPDKKGENAEVALVFSLALTFNKIVGSDNVGDKVVVIMTNDEKIFEGCQTINFEQVPKATLVVLFADDHSIVRRETVLYGSSPISLLDE